MGSRYGGVKQLEPVGPSGEIIMDYSIFDALEAGFNKVIFTIRKDLEKDFKEIIGNRLSKHVKVEYVFQELDELPVGFTKPQGRTKPWGTGQAVLCCKDVVKEPFVVINADDYYGKEAFHIIYDYLNFESNKENEYCMAGFILGNTLSDNGTVTRGVCKVSEIGKLKEIDETSEIVRDGSQASAINQIDEKITIDLNRVVSMNMWGLRPQLFKSLEDGFKSFLSKIGDKELKKEYLLPEVIGGLIKDKEATVSVLKTSDRWFGVTYKEDKEVVVESIQSLVDRGVYPSKLFE